MSAIGAITLPPVSAELLHELRKTFKAPDITVGFDRDKALWAAAQAAVVTWIECRVASTPLSQDPVRAQQAMVRFGS